MQLTAQLTARPENYGRDDNRPHDHIYYVYTCANASCAVACKMGEAQPIIASQRTHKTQRRTERRKMITEFFLPMIPPTVTHQEHKVAIVRGKPVFYEPPKLKEARARLTALFHQFRQRDVLRL